MTVRIRDFHWEEDFELVRTFLIDTYNQTKTLQNWIPVMFENLKFGPGGTEYRDAEDEYVKIWETSEEAKIVAVTVIKPSLYCWIHIHPDHRDLEKEIAEWIHQHVKEKYVYYDDSVMTFLVMESDEYRKRVLTELGYRKMKLSEYNRIRPTDLPIPDFELAEGYSIRHVDIMEELDQYRRVQASVFPHMGNMKANQARLYSTASFYIPELDLVVIDTNGNFAAFCTVRIDPVSRIAEFEPVGTHPEYRRLGLGKALLCEALRRMQKYNPSMLCIQGAAPTDGANRLYEAIGLIEKESVYIWQKTVL
ncbi:MAG: GNAT family N-acetyltransferase [Candidatus Thorarchaeota archaeon]